MLAAGDTPTDAAGAAEAPSLGKEEIEALMSGKAAPAGATATAAAPDATQTSSKSSSGASGQPGATSDVELLLDQAQQAINSLNEAGEQLPEGVEPFRLETFGGTPANSDSATLELVRDVQLDLKIELGRTQMPLENVLRLRRDAVVTLDKLAGDPVDVYVNGRLIARGEVLVLNDNFCVRVTELIVGDSAVA